MAAAPKIVDKKSLKPKALSAIARQQLVLINGLLDEVARNYVARLRRELADLTRALERAESASSGRSPREIKDLHAILKLITQLHINPEKGRRKDLKKIDSLIGDVQSIVDSW